MRRKELATLGHHVAVVLVGGVMLSLTLFFVTSVTPPYSYAGPLCAIRTVEDPGFDPWTGAPHGRVYDCIELGGSRVKRVNARAPNELASRRAVPLPLGFLLGAILTTLAVVATSTAGNDRESDSQLSRS